MHPAAVDVDHLARDEVAVCRRQVDEGPHQVFRQPPLGQALAFGGPPGHRFLVGEVLNLLAARLAPRRIEGYDSFIALREAP